jgi:Arc/MetJ-type ribon-helix-helix transcriptional regulator
MVKTKFLIVRINEAQEAKIMERARKAGFTKKSDYVRFALFKLIRD